MTASLAVSDLHKRYGHPPNELHVLRGIEMRLTENENLAIMGPSGSGKSTLLHLIGTLDKPSSGTIEINGQNPLELSDTELARFRNRVIGFVFQDHHLLPQYSALENVLLPTVAFPSGNNAEERAKHLLERVGLSRRLTHRPAELSGGERQRVAIARALINKPALLLCDEPTGNLDSDSAEGVAALLFELHREEKSILIVVTHNDDLAARFHLLCRLQHGSLVSAR